jgi:membrane-associated phospholipid phosphatase
MRAAATAVGLSVLFLLAYGGTNWFTAQRPPSQIGAWYFAWELAVIPYVPLLIVPYMSIDLLFFFAPFLCRDQRELSVLARRIGFSILTAAAFFLLLPLELAWPPRPRVEGWFGDLIEMSCTAPFLMEYPHNLFPTLHITLCMILAETYGRHTRGVLRVVLYVWFALIGASTVLLWQHHVIDVVGGLMLGCFAFYLFREATPRLPVAVNRRVGGYYLAGALAVLAIMPVIWPWGVFLIWPAAALAIVACAYFGLGPGIYRKTEGRLPLSTRFVLGPVLIGQYLSLLYYRRQCRAWDQVAPGVRIGRVLTDREAAAAIEQGVTAVLDLTAEFSAARPFRAIHYLNVPVLDLTRPTREQLEAATAFISEHAARGTVFVHCKIGYSRSAAVAGAYLLRSRQAATIDEAISRMRSVRPSIVIRPETLEALQYG